MQIVNTIKKFFNLSLNDPKAWDQSLWNLYGSQSLSGENVTESTALTYSAVYNAVSLIAGTVSTLPLHLIRKQDRKTVRAENKTAYRVMHDQANGLISAMAFREAMMSHLLLWGNAYAEKVYNGMGELVEMWPITPNRVKIRIIDGKVFYEISMDKEPAVVLPRAKVLHVAGLGFDGFTGYSVVAMARKSFGLGMSMETFGSLYFGQGTHPGVVVTHPGKLSQQAHDNLNKSLTEAHSGLGQSHRLMLLEESMKVEKIGIAPNESQFLESRQFQIPEIARWFNLPPHKLKDLTKSSFNNIESEQISFVTDSILPWLVRLEQSYNMQLLSDTEKWKEKLYFKHSVEGLLRGNAKNRAEFYAKMWGFGGMSINEIREKEDLDPIEGGDEYFVPLNMVPLSQAGKVQREQGNEEKPSKTEENVYEMVRNNQ